MAWFGARNKQPTGATPARRRSVRAPASKRARPERRGAIPVPRRRQDPAAGAATLRATVSATRAPVAVWQGFAWPRPPWREWTHRSLPVVAMLLVASLLLAGWRLLDHVGSVPVSRVLFTGKLVHVDRANMVELVQPLLVGEGFLTVDIDRIRAALIALPWVADVSVQRRWPDELLIGVREHQPIARWGEDGLLSQSGKVFRPEPLELDGAELPALFGPDQLAGEVVKRYAELSELLAARGLVLRSLGTDQRGSWRLQLQDGVVVRLGTSDVLKKIRRFLGAYEQELRAQFAQVAYVDLRYSNGLAVGWKTQ